MTREGAASPADAPYWLDGPYEPRPPLDRDLQVEACVIGGGAGGLSCALHLARHGVEAVVLERGVVAGGASGRNGGFLIAGAAAFHVDARERYGREHARRIYARTLAAQEDVYRLARELGVEDVARRVGALRVGISEEEAEHVRRHVEALREDGFPAELVERDRLPPALRRYAHNACLTEHDGTLHPARWIRALATAAERAGARIHEGTPVDAPIAAPGEGLVVAGPATVRARHVIVAADAAVGALVPEYAGQVRPRRLHMVATAPVPERLTGQLVYSRWGHEYLQQRPDGRVLAGGFGDLDGERSYTEVEEGSPAIWGRIERHLREDLDLDAELTHRWVGVVGYSDSGLPYVGEVPGRPGLYVAGGYSGTGNVAGFAAGRELADLVAGRKHPARPSML
ncbi:MAG: NAD(P)/FAD-dependent oxidoreductase [Thermoleophilaceae bacterium]